MESITILAEKCQNCQIRDKCDKKRMEACAYFDEPMAASVTIPAPAELTQPVEIKHDYRDIKIGENTTVTIDIEELKKKMVDDFYHTLGFGINYGA